LGQAAPSVDAASMGAAGIERVEAAEAARIEAERAPAAQPSLTALELAQRDDAALREDIGRFGQALRAIEGEKAELARRLGRAEAELARRRSGDASERQRDAFDLDRADWKKLAAEGASSFAGPARARVGGPRARTI
jgi:flagellar motility protein MotE (MotC chaperone)